MLAEVWVAVARSSSPAAARSSALPATPFTERATCSDAAAVVSADSASASVSLRTAAIDAASSCAPAAVVSSSRRPSRLRLPARPRRRPLLRLPAPVRATVVAAGPSRPRARPARRGLLGARRGDAPGAVLHPDGGVDGVAQGAGDLLGPAPGILRSPVALTG